MYSLIPEFNVEESDISLDNKGKQTNVLFHLTKEDPLPMAAAHEPPELAPYLDAFRNDHPDGTKCIFLMMKFRQTPLHDIIVQAILNTCKKYHIPSD